MDADWRPAFRVEAIPSYKAHRVATGDEEEVPDALVPQVAIIEDVLEALGVAGCRGRRLRGRRRHRHRSPRTRPGPVDVVTGDRDLFQLVDDAARSGSSTPPAASGRHDVVDEAWVAAKYGIPGTCLRRLRDAARRPERRAARGAGVGDKTAAALITKYGSLAAMLAALDAGDTGDAGRCADQAGRGPRLPGGRPGGGRGGRPTCRCRVLRRRRIPAKPRDPDRLVELSRALGPGQPAQPGADGVRRRHRLRTRGWLGWRSSGSVGWARGWPGGCWLPGTRSSSGTARLTGRRRWWLRVPGWHRPRGRPVSRAVPDDDLVPGSQQPPGHPRTHPAGPDERHPSHQRVLSR